MSWNDAMAYFKDYRDSRISALNNQTRQRWSTSSLESIATFHDTVFNSDEENAEWARLNAEPMPSISKMAAARMKIAFLAGCRRDTAIMMVAGKLRRVKTPLDHDRYERSNLMFNQGKLIKLDHTIQARKASQ